MRCVPSPPAHDRWDFAFDALLGTGARGAPEGAIADAVQVLREIDEAGTPVVAVDLPTGVDADTGAIARRAVRAELTVTFGEPKRGHLLYPGRAFVGALEVVDIGLAPLVPGDPVALVRVTTAADVAALVPRRDPRAHKGRTGRVLVIGGSLGLTGAVTMTARAASRAGAGYVTVAVPASLHDAVAVQLDSQIPLVCPETTARALAPAAYERLADAFARADVVALGPGLSLDPESAALARRVALETPLPVVIDADALTALAADPSQLARAAGPRVLTPHLGEMSRLTKATAEALEESRIDAPRAWAAAWRATVLLKGAPTVTAGPDARTVGEPDRQSRHGDGRHGRRAHRRRRGAARAGPHTDRRRDGGRVRARRGGRSRRRATRWARHAAERRHCGAARDARGARSHERCGARAR
jgi:NAD(P)H-hydrate epimerase